jgi:hypothetical protein
VTWISGPCLPVRPPGRRALLRLAVQWWRLSLAASVLWTRLGGWVWWVLTVVALRISETLLDAYQALP